MKDRLVILWITTINSFKVITVCRFNYFFNSFFADYLMCEEKEHLAIAWTNYIKP